LFWRRFVTGHRHRARDKIVVPQSEFESEVAKLIVEAVSLETAPRALDPEARLFGEGLGLDSIDLLEVALAVSSKYGFQLRSDDPDNDRIFSSLRALSVHIAQHRTR
jgi:acyl carrier protein